MELRKKKLEVEMERNKLVKENDRLRKENEIFKEKMEEVEAVGDVFVLKNALEELRLLN